MSTSLQIIKKDLSVVRDQFADVAVDKSMSFDREAGFAMQIMAANSYLAKIALDNKASMLSAVVNVAAIGISLNPAKRQAYLVPRDGKVCLDISYMGLLDLAIQSGSIRWGQAELVHEADKFTLNGVDQPPTHERDPFGARGAIIGAYVVVKTADGDYLTTAMPIDEIHAIRDLSSAAAQKGPWKTFPGEMIKKTVIKRAYKLWPKTDRIDQAVHYLNTEGGEGLALEPETAGPRGNALDRLTEDQLLRVRDVAQRVRKGYQNLGAESAAQYIEEQNFDADELVALWDLFGPTESTMRSAIKVAQENLRASAT